jgi:exopolysaccharide biosynthesis protein
MFGRALVAFVLATCAAFAACAAPNDGGTRQDTMADPPARPIQPAPPGSDPGTIDDGDEPAKGQTPVDPVALLEPKANTRLVVGKKQRFHAKAACPTATIELVADGQFVFATSTGPELDMEYALASPGVNRTITARAVSGDAKCAGATKPVNVTVQRALAHATESRVGTNGCAFDLDTIVVPTADGDIDVVVTGGADAETVKSHGQSTTNAIAAINGGYFAFGSGPVSYAKGRTGYESPSGNVKGPRACLAFDAQSRVAHVALSKGGPGSFPNDEEVVCAGPQLLEKGANVTLAHIVSENFETSGLNEAAPYPRSAACVLDDGAVMLAVAQSDKEKACGLSLSDLADALKAKGCVDAINLDGGGSSALWWKGPPARYHDGTEDRPVYNAITVVAK